MASYEGAYFIKPVEINNLLLLSIYALGFSSMTIENFIFLLYSFASQIRSIMFSVNSWVS